MAVLLMKPGVQPKIAHIVATIANVAAPLTNPTEVYLTSVMDGIHSKDSSLHYALRAVDIRTKNFPTTASKLTFLSDLQKALGPDYEVFYENAGSPNEHLHVGYDPR